MTDLARNSRHLTAAMIAVGVGLFAVSSPAAAVSTSVPDFFESGGFGCYDRQAWVWQAPRAERVQLAVVERPANAVCEIGTLGCDRQPESVSSELFQIAEQVCGLKSKQSDHDVGFDSEGCLAAELDETWAALPPITIPLASPRRGPTCGETDPECRSLPPVPASAPQLTTATSAGAAPWLRFSAERPIDEPRNYAPATLLGPAEGTRRRVDRPPAA